MTKETRIKTGKETKEKVPKAANEKEWILPKYKGNRKKVINQK